MSQIKDCPACGAKDSIEAGFMLELDNVVLEREGEDRWTAVDGKPATACRFPKIGVEPVESSNTYVQCRHCGQSFAVVCVAPELMGRWSYTDPNEAVAMQVREALEGDSNDDEHDALVMLAEHLGIAWLSPYDHNGHAHRLFDTLDPHTAENVVPHVEADQWASEQLTSGEVELIVAQIRELDPDNLALEDQ